MQGQSSAETLPDPHHTPGLLVGKTLQIWQRLQLAIYPVFKKLKSVQVIMEVYGMMIMCSSCR